MGDPILFFQIRNFRNFLYIYIMFIQYSKERYIECLNQWIWSPMLPPTTIRTIHLFPKHKWQWHDWNKNNSLFISEKKVSWLSKTFCFIIMHLRQSNWNIIFVVSCINFLDDIPTSHTKPVWVMTVEHSLIFYRPIKCNTVTYIFQSENSSKVLILRDLVGLSLIGRLTIWTLTLSRVVRR